MKNINNNGNMHINTIIDNSQTVQNSNQIKLLVHCTNDELHVEREWRKNQLKKEKKKKTIPSICLAFVIAIISLFIILILNNMFPKLFGEGSLAIFIAIPSAIWAIMAIALYFLPNKYENKHIKALNEIKDILRERE